MIARTERMLARAVGLDGRVVAPDSAAVTTRHAGMIAGRAVAQEEQEEPRVLPRVGQQLCSLGQRGQVVAVRSRTARGAMTQIVGEHVVHRRLLLEDVGLVRHLDQRYDSVAIVRLEADGALRLHEVTGQALVDSRRARRVALNICLAHRAAGVDDQHDVRAVDARLVHLHRHVLPVVSPASYLVAARRVGDVHDAIVSVPPTTSPLGAWVSWLLAAVLHGGLELQTRDAPL